MLCYYWIKGFGGVTMNTDERYISKLQDSLIIIRNIFGWSAEDLGNKIGVSKQTISNIERKNTKLTLTQYIAIRSVIDYEIANSPEQEDLSDTVSILLDIDDSNLSEEDIKKNQESMKLISSAAAGGQMQKKELSFAVKSLIVGVTAATTAVAGYVAGVASSDWLKRIMKNK